MQKDVELVIREIIDNDEEFVVKACEALTVEDLKKVLESKGIILQDDEIEVLFSKLKKEIEKEDVLSEGDLENVSGGFAGLAVIIGISMLLLWKYRQAQLKRKS